MGGLGAVQILIAATGAGLALALLAALGAMLGRSRARQRGARLAALGLAAAAPRELAVAGRRIAAEAPPAGRAGADHLLLSTPLPRLPALRIVRAWPLDRWARRWGIARSAGTGVADFDQRYLLDCDHRGLAPALLGGAAPRAAVDALFDAGAVRLTYASGRLTAAFPLQRLFGDAAPERSLQHWAGALAAAAEALPRFSGVLTPMTLAWPLRRNLVVAAALLLPPAALIACAVLHDAYPPLDFRALAAGALQPLLPAALAALVLGALLLQGHPRSARLLPPLCAAIALGLPPALIALTLARNGGDPGTALQTRVLTVTAQDLRGGPAAPAQWHSSELQRRGLLGHLQPLRAEVPAELAAADPAGARLRVQIAPGRLGHPWVVAVAAEPGGLPAPRPPVSVPAVGDAPATAAAAADADAPATAPEAPDPATAAPADAPAAGPRPRLVPLAMAPPEAGAELLAQAQGLLEQGDEENARAMLDRALVVFAAEKASPAQRANAHWVRARLYERLGEAFDAQCEADARAALALVPDHADAALLLDGVLFRGGRFEEALTLWQDLLERRPAWRHGRYRLARVLATTGRIEAARSAADSACSAGEAPACELRASL